MQDSLGSNPDWAVEQARKLVANGELDNAIKQLKLYVAAHPRDIGPARYLGDLYYRKADLAAAAKTFLAILQIAPDDRETHNRLGGVYAAQDRIADSIDEFQRSIPSVGAYPHLVDLHRRRGDLDAFTNELRVKAAAHEFDAGDQFSLGQVLRAEHKPVEALGFLQRALEIQSRNCQILSELGSTYLDLNDVHSAIDVLERCLVINPREYAALVNLGDAYVQNAQLDRARAEFEAANLVRVDGSEALIDLGYLDDVAGNWDDAVHFYLRAIAVDPLARDAYVNLGYDYEHHRLFALAEAAYIKGLSVVPGDGRLHYLLGETYQEQGKTALARQEWQRALSSDEPDVANAASYRLALQSPAPVRP